MTIDGELAFAAVIDQHRFLQQLDFLLVVVIDIRNQGPQVFANLLRSAVRPIL